jgi:hypothetical protein
MKKLSQFFLSIALLVLPYRSFSQEPITLIEFSQNIENKLAQVHTRLMNNMASTKTKLYTSDSFASTYTTAEIKLKVEDPEPEYYLRNRIITPITKTKKNPAIIFSYSLSNDFNSNSVKIQLLGISPMKTLYASGVDLGMQSFAWIKTEDLPTVLPPEDIQFLKALQMVIRNRELFESLYVQDTAMLDQVHFHLYKDYWQEPLHAILDTVDLPFIDMHMEQALHHALRRFNFEHKFPVYSDKQTTQKLEGISRSFFELFVTQIQNPLKPDDPYDLIDTAMQVPVNLFDNASVFSYLEVESKKVIQVHLGKAKNDQGSSIFYINFSDFQSTLKEWDNILLLELINQNKEK